MKLKCHLNSTIISKIVCKNKKKSIILVSYAFVILSFSTLLLSGATGCGGPSVDFDEDGCADDGTTFSDHRITAEFSGDPCKTPQVTNPADNILILDCLDRSTKSTSQDFIDITCENNDSSIVQRYTCQNGKVLKLTPSEDVLFEETSLECTTTPTLVESENIIG